MVHIELEYSNKTTYSIKSDVSKYAWEVFLIFVAISSLIGDSTILIASIKYKVFKLKKIIVAIIQHIAMCDMMVVLADVIPRIISIIADEWVFGNRACRVFPYARFYLFLAIAFLICAMTTSKMCSLKLPLSFGKTSIKRAHWSCVACWVAAAVFPSFLYLLSDEIAYFSYRSYQCDLTDLSQRYRVLKPIVAVLSLVVPACVVVGTTTYILIIAMRSARRVRGDLKWQGTMATLLTAFFYILSVAPQLIYRILEYILTSEDNENTNLLTHFFRMTITFHSLNIISNFYIYCLTVTSFRQFVLTAICRCNIQESVKIRGMASHLIITVSKISSLMILNSIIYLQHNCSSNFMKFLFILPSYRPVDISHLMRVFVYIN